jgi:beta-lactamase superfamily II metal-dependent hydrolase
MPNRLPADAVRIRMYRVGFGDCFLLSVPVGGGHRHLLVDCGVHPSGDIGAMPRVVADIAAVTGRRLAVIVASHEHADHISGYGAFAAEFARFEIGAVWMPWAMDPDDTHADALRRRRLALADDLAAHFRATPASPEARHALLNLRGNEAAVAALRSGFRGAAREVRYLKAGVEARPPLDGLGVRVLGPPTDPEFLKKMEPPRSQRYVRLGAGGLRETINGVEPFEARWRLAPAAGRKAYDFPADSKRDLSERDVKEGAGSSLDGLAFVLDSAVNNTSLALAFNFRGRLLLFPGDAQWGNWKSWLERPGSGGLLEQVAFLKVAHHGSHNATPRSALEAMGTDGFAAMVSTQGKPWPSIPQPELMRRLRTRTKSRVLRSDWLHRRGAPDGPGRPRRVPRGFRRGELWWDCNLKA